MRSSPILRPCRVLVIDADRHAAAHTAQVLLACGHWARCATSAAAVMRAVRSQRFDVLMMNAASFSCGAEVLLRQVRRLYPIAAVELSEHAPWFEKHRAAHEGFDHCIRNPVTANRVMEALWHVADPPTSDNAYGSFPNRG